MSSMIRAGSVSAWRWPEPSALSRSTVALCAGRSTSALRCDTFRIPAPAVRSAPITPSNARARDRRRRPELLRSGPASGRHGPEAKPALPYRSLWPALSPRPAPGRRFGRGGADPGKIPCHRGLWIAARRNHFARLRVAVHRRRPGPGRGAQYNPLISTGRRRTGLGSASRLRLSVGSVSMACRRW